MAMRIVPRERDTCARPTMSHSRRICLTTLPDQKIGGKGSVSCSGHDLAPAPEVPTDADRRQEQGPLTKRNGLGRARASSPMTFEARSQRRRGQPPPCARWLSAPLASRGGERRSAIAAAGGAAEARRPRPHAAHLCRCCIGVSVTAHVDAFARLPPTRAAVAAAAAGAADREAVGGCHAARRRRRGAEDIWAPTRRPWCSRLLSPGRC